MPSSQWNEFISIFEKIEKKLGGKEFRRRSAAVLYLTGGAQLRRQSGSTPLNQLHELVIYLQLGDIDLGEKSQTEACTASEATASTIAETGRR